MSNFAPYLHLSRQTKTGMKNYLKNTILMLLALPAAFSCSAFLMETENASIGEDMSLLITGTVSEIGSSVPLEGMKISFKAYPKGRTGETALHELNVYTDNHGSYILESEGYSEEITCHITASDTEQTYSSSVNEVEIAWSGVSFDKEKGRFVVNDCDFKLSRNI